MSTSKPHLDTKDFKFWVRALVPGEALKAQAGTKILSLKADYSYLELLAGEDLCRIPWSKDKDEDEILDALVNLIEEAKKLYLPHIHLFGDDIGMPSEFVAFAASKPFAVKPGDGLDAQFDDILSLV